MEFVDGAASVCDDEGLSGGIGGSNECVMNLSPRGTKYWIPICDKASQPFVGQRFSKLDDGVDFYVRMDNHKKSVTFAVGLIAKEDIDSYVWLLDNLKQAMGHEPTYVVTNQDPSLRVAVLRFFTSAQHRFCMWHIMTNVGDKVRAVLANDQPFRQDLNAIVWDECITIEQFESKWLQIMEVHGLVEHRWLQLMFELRAFWIPAFFRDLPMSGLVRSTSRSESQNSSFGGCTNCHASLVEFFIHFEGAIDSQRHKQAKLDAACEGYLPVVKTPLAIERYAASVYTITIFYDVQAEIVAGCFECRVLSFAVDDDVKRVEVEGENGVVCVVVFHMAETTASCSCWMFERVGLLCRHIFLVLKDAHVDSIPACYVVSRWTHDVYKRPIYDIDGVHDASALRGNSSKSAMKEELKLSFVDADSTLGSSVAKSGVIRSFGGVLASSEIVGHPPTVAKNKGFGKRFKTAKELALEKHYQKTRK
ncbi:protein FAR1-RELATED SEQUENCE 5-like [Ipomoea triloba]|uniref:protein FAR1-RELATED SEQUENCE 5-like n=1 Tax=Ipomoea triloba TaxID=35885 RepID=UPI00125DA79E|nr:protein FAR1-RELATED SEQUENCE 5-like [Ipomoea triloba]